MFGRLPAFRRSLFFRLERLEDRHTPAAMNPSQILHAYGFDQVAKISGKTLDGTGQIIAIVDAFYDANAASDLAAFDSDYGLPAPPSFTQVNQTGGDPSGLSRNSGWARETALDIEWAHAIAPGADILLVEASTNSSSNLFTAVDYARSYTRNQGQEGVSVVSMSWGGGESSSNSHFTTPGNHTGVSFFAASGDTGGAVSYPSSSPNVVSVGGTTLNLSGGNYGSESAWGSGGGGPSALFTKPSWQTAYSGTMRGTPDVSYDADLSTGYFVYNSGDGGLVQVGGTSAAAPQWAALVALADQGRSLVGFSNFDGPSQLLPALYTIPASDYNDVTSGSNGYPATAGYDLATGRGTPKAQLVIADLVAYGSTAPSVSTQPISRTLTVGQSVTFTAAANGNPAPTVQWQVSTDGGITYTNISGATGLAYTVTPSLADSGDRFRAVFTNVAGSMNTSSALLTVTPPVTIAGVQVNDGSNQRSEVASITVTFSGPVNFAGGANNAAAAFQLLHIQTGNNVLLSSDVSADGQGRTVVTLYFSGSETDPISGQNGGLLSLADGRYVLTVLSGSIADVNGAALDGDGDGVAGGDYVSPPDTYGGTGLRLYRLFGDVNGDGVVDATDVGQLKSTFNRNSSDPLYLWYLDADNSGAVDASDIGQFKTRFNVNVF
jgi:subtilase family serine protease